MGLDAGWSIQFGRGKISKTAGFCEYFGFSCQIRKDTNLGQPYLDSPQNCAPGDTHIVHFDPDPNMSVGMYLGHIWNVPGTSQGCPRWPSDTAVRPWLMASGRCKMMDQRHPSGLSPWSMVPGPVQKRTMDLGLPGTYKKVPRGPGKIPAVSNNQNEKLLLLTVGDGGYPKALSNTFTPCLLILISN